MQRLVYSPKVNAWVKTDHGVVDLSEFIVAGSVSRKLNQVSSATLRLRNPKKRDGKMLFTETIRPDGSIGPLMHPMDPIIITLTRLRGRPIQVFTGYCDSTPYYQLYPGVVNLEASCTLKRLQYTYWDPGLDFTRDFLQNYGWYPDAKHGGISNPKADSQKLKDVNSFNDGSIGNLLHAVLRDIGGWDESTIFIEPLPKTIGPLVTRLFTEFKAGAQENHEIQTEFEGLLTALIGPHGDSGGGGGGSGIGDTKGLPKGVHGEKGQYLGTFSSTAYGPPWNAMQGFGTTATGIDLRPAKKAFGVAVDPNVIRLNTNLIIEPNPFGVHDTVFRAFDTGGAIKGHRIDFYDWRGRSTQVGWGVRNVRVWRAK